jgi:hypothetical protein
MQITKGSIETVAGPIAWFPGSVYVDAAGSER